MTMSRVVLTTWAAAALGCAAIAGTLGFSAGAPPSTGAGHPSRATSSAAPRSDAQALLSKLPLYFIENRGQVDARVAYYVQGRDTAVYFTASGVTFALTAPTPSRLGGEHTSRRLPVRRVSMAPERTARERWAVRLDFVGARPVTPHGEESKSAVVSYFKGRRQHVDDRAQDLRQRRLSRSLAGHRPRLHGRRRRLKYTFVVKPGADPGQIRLAYRGATAVTLTDAGRAGDLDAGRRHVRRAAIRLPGGQRAARRGHRGLCPRRR